MKIGIIFLIFFILLSFSCRKKIADDYAYYQPYKRDTALKKINPQKLTTADSIQTEKNTVQDFKPVDLNDKYFIVIASFSVEEYALIMKDDLIKKGFKPEIFMLNNDGWHKLAISSYNNNEDATEAMNRIKQKGGLFSEARIVIK